ncbi:Kinase suppressor of Ras 1 [Daphnia magna]|uniref:Kinase suppressor of Ras 1 n=1 Tax=Daphnia magna TaxID=35525 RepID=A0A162RSW9_9CRUS|nr:Kinase suppressor of Ras 1 [Daphnia magna]
MDTGAKKAVAEVNSCNIIQTLLDISAMIDIHAKHLEGLRTQCSTSAELIQQEIRTIEGKLVKLFSKQLVAKAKIPIEGIPYEVRNIPSIKQWLQVVGISQPSVEALCAKFQSLESLQELCDHEIKRIFNECYAKEDEYRRLIRALQSVKRYTEVLVHNEKEGSSGRTTPDLALYWDSWDNVTQALLPITTSAQQNENIMHNPLNIQNIHTVHETIPQTAPENRSPPSTPSVLKGRGDRMKFPATPPPRKKNQVIGGAAPLLTDFPLTKSTSHESQLANRIDGNDVVSGASTMLLSRFRRTKPNAYWLGRSMEHLAVTGSSSPVPSSNSNLPGASPANTMPTSSTPSKGRHRLATDPCSVADDSNDETPNTTVSTPKSPRTPTVGGPAVMAHTINHRFTMTFKMLTVCDLCLKQMFIGLKCKECKYKCHRDCATKVPPSCKLPPGFIDYVRQCISDGPQTPILQRTAGLNNAIGNSIMSVPSPSMIRLTPHDKKKSRTQPAIHMNQGGGSTSVLGFGMGSTHFDSSSTTSSCSSSTPSSPALALPSHISANHTPTSASQTMQFRFPDVRQADRAQSVETLLSPLSHMPHSAKNNSSIVNSLVNTSPVPVNPSANNSTTAHTFQDQSKIVSVSGLSGTSGSNSTSTDSERTYRVDSQDSQISDTETSSDRHWPRQNSLSLREWDIPFHELELRDPIGQGRFGTVHRGIWHGNVAVRLLNMDQIGDEKVLESFKLEVATFRKTRHENLVLFMGACMNLPTLALVTSMCKGLTLYTHLHLRKDKFSINKTVIIAQQISQGMGYLHARGIIHKDLKSKNIFLENGKVIITDFGLFSVSKLCKIHGRSDALSIPPGWLCYMAPEVMRSLKPSSEENDELPFTMASDAYAFGTVWYELLCGEWPYKEHCPEAMIWQIGRGMKQSLANLQASRDLKDILMACWAFDVKDRAEFSKLLKILEALPKKRLLRSPSHPVHLSRSAESVF